MLSQNDPVTLTLIALITILVIGVAGYALAAKVAARRRARDGAALSAMVVDYFRRTGVAVSADCLMTGDGFYTVMVESEPMKRFRLSHIIEMTLREHLRKACGVELGKIYWRFPINEAAAAPAAAAAAAASSAAPPGAQPQGAPEETSDAYINEGLEHYRHIPQAEVTELPWETFEEVTTGAEPKDPSSR